MYIFASVPQKSQNDLGFLEELHNITPLAGLGLLHKVGWISALHYHLW